MDVEIIKQGLKEILNEDISIRTSMQDLRRNVFLQSSKAEEKESQVQAKESKIAELSSEIDYFRNQLSIREKSLEEKLEDFEAEKKNLLEQLNQREQEVARLTAELADQSKSREALAVKNEELNRMSLENSHYAAKIRELVEHIAKLEDEKEKLARENTANRLKAEQAETNGKQNQKDQLEIERLKKLVFETESRLDLLVAENKSLQEETGKIQRDLSELAKINSQLQSSEMSLNSRIPEIEAENSEIRSLNAELQDANFEFINAYSHLKFTSEETLDVLKEEISQMELFAASEIEKLKKEIEETKSQDRTAEMSRQLAELEIGNEELKKIIEGLQSIEQNYSYALLRISELEGALEEMNGLKEAAEESVALKAKTAVLLEEIERLNAETQSIRSEFLGKEQELIRRLETVQQQTAAQPGIDSKEVQAIKIENTRLNTLSAMLKKRIAELEEQVVGLRQTAEKAGESEALTEELNKMTAEMNVHLKAIGEMEVKTGSLNQELQEKSLLLIQFQTERNMLMTECTRLKNEIIEGEETYNKLLDELHAGHTAEINALKAQLNEQQATTAAGDEVAVLREQIAHLMAEKEQLEYAMNNSSAAETKIAELQHLADEINSEKVKLEETITDLKRELFKAEEKLEKFETESKEQNEEFIDGLFKKIDLLNEKTHKLQQQKEEIERQVPDLLTKIAELSDIIDSQKSNADKNHEPGLEKDNNSPNLAGMLADSLKDKKSAKLKINELVREIDRCIAMLTTQS